MSAPDRDSEPPVFGLPLQELLMNVWFDGFTSGAGMACSQFLTDEAADAKADQLAEAALASSELRACVQHEVQDRMREMMERHMATSQPIPGLKPSDLNARRST
ncbi:Uncharacterised protein [Mycobacteroides abscessus subsp. abscessus]|uniref:hypothetical protein n=1 Tax=Mycobacteroides abscessus TaxID=36809 RepID=UPI000928FC89|nr:hypothetical protein [Mycobacteroides abscessus]SIH25124.1 Uncharacterised protein [Mycobacteroides abscessus subsp. abscessus]